ncbi:hypothetical protein ACXN5S_14315 [Pseudoroseicyclus sp. H15]
MFPANDPRASLAPAGAAPKAVSTKAASYARFYAEPPQESSPQGDTWYARGQNLVVAYTAGKAGLVLARSQQCDEYALLSPELGGAQLLIEAGGEEACIGPETVAFVPPGESTVTLLTDGIVVRMITTQNPDVAAKCSNASHYDEPDANVAPFAPWPAPPGPPRIRTYSTDVPDESGRFGRLFRGSTVMVNIFKSAQPRDTTRLSPHHHADFEQYSLCLAGNYIHYLRYPWTTNLADWRPDEAEDCGAPSVAVIPPPAIHTSQSMNPAGNMLVDIFCPPRFDLAAKPGWVLNADDYPAPETPDA